MKGRTKKEEGRGGRGGRGREGKMSMSSRGKGNVCKGRVERRAKGDGLPPRSGDDDVGPFSEFQNLLFLIFHSTKQGGNPN
jgi:hypothetical protein